MRGVQLVAVSLFAAANIVSVPFAQAAPGGGGPSFPHGSHANVCGPVQAGEARCHALIVTDSKGAVFTAPSPAGYTPADLLSAYNAPGTGAATTIAIITAFDYPDAEADLATYRAQFRLPPCASGTGCFRKIGQNGQPVVPADKQGKPQTEWNREAALDLDMAGALCASCSLLLVEATTNKVSDMAAAVNTAAAAGAMVISNSYGADEAGTGPLESAYDHPGVAITASSGDRGFQGAAQFPASSPHVTAVGGTSLTRTSGGRGWAEVAWDGAGSGCSALYDKPSWQTDTGCGKRTVADVSAVADSDTGVAVFGPANPHQSAWMVMGGTSVSAPLIAGIYGANGRTVTYGSDPYRHLSALFDVTSGTNRKCGGYLCTAATGYDGPTGLGTPNGPGAFPGGTVQKVLPFTGLHQPLGVAVDAAGSVFVVDVDNARVVKLSADGVQSVLPFSGLTFPQGVAVDSAGDVFVTDPAYGSIPGRVLELPAGSGTPVELPFADLSGPSGIAVDAAGAVYVGDYSGVRKLLPGAANSTTLPFTGLDGSATGVAVTAAGDVLVVDANHNRVLRLAAGATTQTVLPFTALSQPQGVAVDAAGTVFVTDSSHQRVVKLPAGAAGQSGVAFTDLQEPFGVAVDTRGNLYVSDYSGGANKVYEMLASDI
ncbi:S8 family serine peptidase [Nocardia sp. NPDC004582]